MSKVFRNMKIRTQLMGSFAFIIVFAFALILTALITINSLTVLSQYLFNSVVQPIDYVLQSTRLMESIRNDGRSALLNSDAGAREQNAAQIFEDVGEVQTMMAKFRETIEREEAYAYHDALMDSLAQYIELFPAFRELVRQDWEAAPEIRDEAIAYLDGRLSPLSSASLDNLVELSRIRVGLAEELTSNAITNVLLSNSTIGPWR